jgi:hypothetical protein
LRDLFDRERDSYFPADADDHAGYQERFRDTARVFEVFLRRTRSLSVGTEGAPVAIVVMPWFATPAPWYSIAVGLGLARRGLPVTFVWHDLPTPDPFNTLEEQNDEIGRILHSLRPRFPVVRVSEIPISGSSVTEIADDALLEDLTRQHLTWSTRAAVELNPHDMALAPALRAQLSAAFPSVRAVIQNGDFRYLVTCGGVLSASGLYLAAARESGVRAATLDAGLGWVVVGTEGVAAQQTDLARAFSMLWSELDGDVNGVIDEARAEFERRRSATDATSYQKSRARGSTRDEGASDILIPLSVMFDTAALGRNHLFEDSKAWLVETVGMLLQHTHDRIIIRQHPSERRAGERSRFDAAAVLTDAFGHVDQVEFVPAEDPVNSYDLLAEARLVIPFVSTIGIEAAALGKPTIVGGSVYYSDLGFAWSARTPDEYLDLIARGARGELEPLPEQADRAWVCYYLNAVCQRVWSDFTPQPSDFWRWVKRHPEELYTSPAVDDILTGLDDNVPVAILRHRRRRTQDVGSRDRSEPPPQS